MASCQISVPPLAGIKNDVLTVGRVFQLSCRGEFSGKNLQGTPERVLEGQDPYALKLLDNEFVSAEELKLIVTSYRTGPQNIENLKLKWGEEILELGPLQFEVQSVIEGQQQPFGPMALTKAWPMSIWISIAVALAFLVLMIAIRVRRYVQRKNLIEELRQHDSAMSPLAELHQKYRRWRRNHEFFYGRPAQPGELKSFLNDVDQAFRLFLVRVFKVPALKWGQSLVMKDIKKYHRQTYDEFRPEMLRLFTEINKAKAANTLQSQDLIQLAESLRILAEKIIHFRERGGTK